MDSFSHVFFYVFSSFFFSFFSFFFSSFSFSSFSSFFSCDHSLFLHGKDYKDCSFPSLPHHRHTQQRFQVQRSSEASIRFFSRFSLLNLFFLQYYKVFK
ncbi:MAG TPA: hypothetical protein ENI73_02365 [Spirochaetes bacterium]|nr:hypothetical protein [Spirochaetota bacterium]